MCKDDNSVSIRTVVNKYGNKVDQITISDPQVLGQLPHDDKIHFVDGPLAGELAGVRYPLRDDGGWASTNLWRSVHIEAPLSGLALELWVTAEPLPGHKHVIVSPTGSVVFPEDMNPDDHPVLHRYILRDDGYCLAV